MPMPNFLIIGVGRSGTTSLYHYLKQHPEVYMCPNKEPNFFAQDEPHHAWNGPIKRPIYPRTKTLTEYLELFEGVVNEKAIGEASVSNFYACDQIHEQLRVLLGIHI